MAAEVADSVLLGTLDPIREVMRRRDFEEEPIVRRACLMDS